MDMPYTTKPEDIIRLLELLPSTEIPEGKIDLNYIKSLGFSQSSAKYLFNILKMLGFVDDQDMISAEWRAYAQEEKSGLHLAASIRNAYKEMFDCLLCPYLEDDETLFDFFKRSGKATSREVDLMVQTFRNLASMADFQDLLSQYEFPEPASEKAQSEPEAKVKVNPNLQLNIQVHIDPNTPDEKIEAIFKNMQKYLLWKRD